MYKKVKGYKRAVYVDLNQEVRMAGDSSFGVSPLDYSQLDIGHPSSSVHHPQRLLDYDCEILYKGTLLPKLICSPFSQVCLVLIRSLLARPFDPASQPCTAWARTKPT